MATVVFPIVGTIVPTPPVTVTADYTVQPMDCFVRCDATNGPIEIMLPAATGSGRQIVFSKRDGSTNAVTAKALGNDLINASPELATATQYESISLSDGAAGQWDIF